LRDISPNNSRWHTYVNGYSITSTDGRKWWRLGNVDGDNE